MSEDNTGPGDFEERVRAIAREVSRSVERLTEFDIDEIAKEWADAAGRWLAGRAETFGDDVRTWTEPFGDHPVTDEPPRASGPHPLDLPTEAQGLALSALDSGRWTVEPGSNVIVADGDGPGPSETTGLVGELRARDWIAADGGVTVVGHDALARWLDRAHRR
jgi:hypothetical protein